MYVRAVQRRTVDNTYKYLSFFFFSSFLFLIVADRQPYRGVRKYQQVRLYRMHFENWSNEPSTFRHSVIQTHVARCIRTYVRSKFEVEISSTRWF